MTNPGHKPARKLLTWLRGVASLVFAAVALSRCSGVEYLDVGAKNLESAADTEMHDMNFLGIWNHYHVLQRMLQAIWAGLPGRPGELILVVRGPDDGDAIAVVTAAETGAVHVFAFSLHGLQLETVMKGSVSTRDWTDFKRRMPVTAQNLESEHFTAAPPVEDARTTILIHARPGATVVRLIYALEHVVPGEPEARVIFRRYVRGLRKLVDENISENIRMDLPK